MRPERSEVQVHRFKGLSGWASDLFVIRIFFDFRLYSRVADEGGS